MSINGYYTYSVVINRGSCVCLCEIFVWSVLFVEGGGGRLGGVARLGRGLCV